MPGNPTNQRTITLVGGTEYVPVSVRAQQHRERHHSEVVSFAIQFPSPNLVVAECRISEIGGRLLANGFAEEDRRNGVVNSTSAVENAQTSAWGRALFVRGFGNGTPMPAAITLENGSLYEPVELRAQRFREHNLDDTVEFVITEMTNERVLVECRIMNQNNVLKANAFAEERRDLNEVNQVSAVENAQTSAYGRALFALGFGNGEICSAQELQTSQRNRQALDQLANAASSSAVPAGSTQGAPAAEAPAGRRQQRRQAPPAQQSAPQTPRYQAPIELIPETLRGAANLVFEKHGDMLFVRGQTAAATSAVRGLLEGAQFRGNVWVKRAPADGNGVPADLPPVTGIRYDRHGDMVIATGNTYINRRALKDNGFELWWLKPLVSQRAAA